MKNIKYPWILAFSVLLLGVAAFILVYHSSIGQCIDFADIPLAEKNRFVKSIKNKHENRAIAGYFTQGNRIYNSDGLPHQFVGVARPSLEWVQTGENISREDFAKMRQLGINLVRLPLNQQYYLQSEEYRRLVDRSVEWINSLGMAVMLDLHWSDKGGLDPVAEQQVMADKNSLIFWREVATLYKDNSEVIFELYNEPHDISPEVWLNGGPNEDGFEAVGMQTMADLIRNEVGADNLIVVNGINWGYDHQPLARVEGKNIIYGTHPYGQHPGKQIRQDWDAHFGFLSADYPVMITEFGDTSACEGVFQKELVEYANEHSMSWVAWAWYPADCGFPSLIQDWSGTLNAAGASIFPITRE
ncbi:MAG: glycoside hydrolase family 5 protein [Patescibacteria group bacterium]